MAKSPKLPSFIAKHPERLDHIKLVKSMRPSDRVLFFETSSAFDPQTRSGYTQLTTVFMRQGVLHRITRY